MKVIGYMPLHYGAEYLKESLLSAIDLVDEFVVLYSPRPSYGYGTDAINPDSEDDLKTISEGVCGDKLKWISKDYHSEGLHRKEIFNHTNDYDLLVTLDADEVFDTEELRKALDISHEGVHRNYGIDGYVNLWRSFDYACYDGFRPVRVINLNNQHKDQSTLNVTIWHFGCCQNEDIMRYKYLIHGHKDELRTNWLDEVFYGWTPDNQLQNLHPVANGLWNAVEYDKEKMPTYLKEHENFNKELA